MHSFICETSLVLLCCRDLCSIGGGVGVSLPWVYVHSSICETSCVYWCCIDVWLIGGLGVHLSWVYVHSSLCETYWV